MKKLVLVIALLVAMPLVLVGCAKSESAAVEDSINGFVTALNDGLHDGDYEKCTDYLLGVDEATKTAIEEQLKGLQTYLQSIEVTKIEDISIDGSSATAKVTLKVTLTAALGGQSMEQTIELPLTKVDGKWKFAGENIIPETGG